MNTDKYIEMYEATDRAFSMPFGAARTQAMDRIHALHDHTPGLQAFSWEILDMRSDLDAAHGSYLSHKQLHGKET